MVGRPKRETFNGKVELLRERYLKGLSIWTGEPLEGEDLAEWKQIMALKEAWEERELATHSA
tara:strand:- start:1292 stop:1477 length:186 start_codon:yes stop_codon:yes gene_type:complete